MAIDADEDDVGFVQFVPETTKGVVVIAVIVVVEVVENDDDDEEEEDDGDDDEVDEVNKVLFKSTTFADNNAEEAETEADDALLVLDTCLPDVDSNADDGTDSILPNLDDDCIFLVRALNADEVDVVDNEVDNGVFLEAPDDDDDEEDEDNNDIGDQRNKFIFLNNLLVLLGNDSNDNDEVNDNGDEVIADLLPINLFDDEEAMADLPAVKAELERDDEEDDDI